MGTMGYSVVKAPCAPLHMYLTLSKYEQQVYVMFCLKIGCTAANPRLLREKALYYGTIELLKGNFCLRFKRNLES